ncbi:uncharacterized protein MELLADRAFT_103637 [Melampsora larici-populina 98AG31]|uniref:Uncharacterized protein n=1 Tax=Melampsora larici-populina (strain 98AG31 / pathotype 3-4-7) TaxID=747676 RepID=F4RBZ4_MELLP|nr:uncharacterized protein MELLADRAFT_103637 [Melampsora larici-populina 98AG31]EGG10189.1 hypothetical protein MELLADRAFT_103637 [Melampsora larici-populina 98AG31]
MGQKGRVIKGPLGPKPKRQRAPGAPKGSSQADAELTAVEFQSALANAEELNRALAKVQNQQDNQNYPYADQQGHLHSPPSNADMNGPKPNIGYKSSSSVSSQSVMVDAPTPQSTGLPMSFGEYIRGAYYKSKQLKEHIRWKKVLGPMFATYMSQSDAIGGLG